MKSFDIETQLALSMRYGYENLEDREAFLHWLTENKLIGRFK